MFTVKLEDTEQDCANNDRVKDYGNREREKPEKCSFGNSQSGLPKLSLSIRDKYIGKSINELDLADCESCTPSYRLLPKDVRNFVF